MKRKRGLRRLSVKTFILAIQSPCTIQGCYFDHPSIYLIFLEAQKSDLEKSVIYDLRFHGLNFGPNFLFLKRWAVPGLFSLFSSFLQTVNSK